MSGCLTRAEAIDEARDEVELDLREDQANRFLKIYACQGEGRCERDDFFPLNLSVRHNHALSETCNALERCAWCTVITVRADGGEVICEPGNA